MANYIGNQPLNGEFKVLDSIESQFNNSSTSFGLKYNTASQTVGDAAQLIVSLNGVIQQPLTSYTLSGVTNIVFASPPSSGDTCFIILLGGIGGTVTPSDNSVTTEKLTNSSVTSAKIVNNTITADDMDSSDSYAFAGVNVGSTFVTDTVNDRIGVGTTNPTYPLDVEDTGAGFIKGSFVSTGSAHSTISFDNTGSTAASVRVGSNNNDFYVRTSGSEKLRVTSGGSVGIGTSSPNTALHIVGLNQTNGTLDLTPNAAKGSFSSYVHYGTNGDWYIRSASASGNVIIQDTGGKVGIGTSSPSSFSSFGNNLVIGDGSNNEGMTIYSSSVGSFYFSDGTSGDDLFKGIIQYSHSADTLDFYANYVSGDDPSMRIDASGNVGIGVSDPSSYYAENLVVKAPAEGGITIRSNATTDTNYLMFADGTAGTSAYRGYIGYTHNSPEVLGIVSYGYMRFYTGDPATERMRIDSSGRVGIGTDSPDHPLEVVGAISSADTGLQKATFANVGNDLVMTANAGATNVSSNIIFKSSQSGGSAAERMRLDASGNLLVGMTSASTNNDGVGLRSDGLIHGKRAGVVATFNRKTSDGAVVEISKDNTVVGSIGSTGSGTQPYFVKSSTGGFKIGNDVSTALLLPVNADGSNSDGGAQLGFPANRWKDLYLSGGVYLGGTGSANKLDDYEEGTFTPTVVELQVLAPTVYLY
jgi:hypothetical protein